MVMSIVQQVESRQILLVQPARFPGIWILPQEGMRPDDTAESASIRCLDEELGLDQRTTNFRNFRWLGSRLFPEERRDERPVEFSLIKMRGKAYYASLIFCSDNPQLHINCSEIAETRWIDSSEIDTMIAANVPEKKRLILRAMEELSVE